MHVRDCSFMTFALIKIYVRTRWKKIAWGWMLARKWRGNRSNNSLSHFWRSDDMVICILTRFRLCLYAIHPVSLSTKRFVQDINHFPPILRLFEFMDGGNFWAGHWHWVGRWLCQCQYLDALLDASFQMVDSPKTISADSNRQGQNCDSDWLKILMVTHFHHNVRIH